MFARFFIIAVCIGFSVRFLVGFFFDQYGLISLNETLQYERSLRDNLQKLEEVQSSYQKKEGRGVEPGDIALISDEDLVIRINGQSNSSNQTHLIGSLYEFPAGYRDNRDILRLIGGIAGVVSYLVMLCVKWSTHRRRRKWKSGALYPVSGRASR